MSQCRRPLSRPSQIEGVLERQDHGAVYDPRNHWRYLSGHDGNHGFVKQGYTFRDLSHRDQSLAPAKVAEGYQIRVADLAGLAESGMGSGGVTLIHAL